MPLTSLDVEVHADYDVRGELGVSDDVRPGHGAIRYVVRVCSPASDEAVRALIDTADRHSSWRDNIANPVPLARELHITSAATPAV